MSIGYTLTIQERYGGMGKAWAKMHRHNGCHTGAKRAG